MNIEKHYLWQIRRINKLLDRFPRWNLTKDGENHELNFEKFVILKKNIEVTGGRIDPEYAFLMNAREGFILKLARFRGDR